MKKLLVRLLSRPIVAAELLTASLLVNLLALASPLFVIQVLNRYVAYGVDTTLATLTSGVVIAVLLEFAFRQVRMKLAGAVSARPDERISLGAFSVLTSAKAAALQRIDPGLRREIMNGSATVETAYTGPNIVAVLDVPFALLYVAALFLLSPLLAGIVGVVLAAVFLIGMAGAAALRRPSRELLGAAGKANTILGTANQAVDTVRAFGAGANLREGWRGHVRLVQGLRRRIAGRQGAVQSITQSAGALMGVAVIAVGATLVVAGRLDVGALIGANILAARALGPIARFAQLGEVFAKAKQALVLLEEFSRLPRESERGSAKRNYEGGLELRDLAFAHPHANAPLFESLSLDLPPGSVLAVIGGNGSGKTTFGRLLLGLIEPSRGQILVDGLDLRQTAPEWWRRQVVYLPQEPLFLDATLADNLRTLDPDTDDACLNRVIDAAGLRRFVDESEAGLDTLIADNGRRLSLGIRRRLALARALTSDGALVVLDEPTEGLDAAGCAAMYAVMNDFAQRGKTIVVMSHDPNILKGAHAVVDLDGKPVPRVRTVTQPITQARLESEARDIVG